MAGGVCRTLERAKECAVKGCRVLPLVTLASILLSSCGPGATPTPTAAPTSTRVLIVVATAAVPPTSTPTATLAPASVTALTWRQLKAATYLLPKKDGGPPDGLLPMEEGAFTYAFVPGAASVENYYLYRGVAFGDLNADGAEDAVVILVHSSAGSGTFYHLAVVLNEGGQPRPLSPVFLGDRIVVEHVSVVEGEIDLLLRTYRPDEPFGSTPTLQVAQRYRLSGATVELLDSETLNADRVVSETPTREAVPIVFGGGERSARFVGTTQAFGLDVYTLFAEAGQTLSVNVTSPNDDVFLSIYGQEQGSPLVRSVDEVANWSGVVPVTQEYAINVFAIGLQTEYTLLVELPSPQATPTTTRGPGTVPPRATEPPTGSGGERTVYLTFDDGPTPPYTPEMLELLARYDAGVTFFVVGRNAERFPDLLEAAHAGGHVLGNHTYNHRSLAGISAEDFAAEVQSTADLLGAYAAPCLRPPYGATDAFTRALAAEMGYAVILWNVDTLDWKQPGAEEIVATIVDQVYPGAIVLMHDGGGDREQTVAALETVLQELSAEGYTFQPICPPA